MMPSIPDKAKVNAKRYAETLLPRLIEQYNLFYHTLSFSSRVMRLLTWQSWLKTGLPPTAVNLLPKMNCHQTH